MVQEVKREIDLIEMLTAQGFSEETIRKAFRLTPNRNIEDIIGVIDEMQKEEEIEVKQKKEILTNQENLKREMEERRKEQQKNEEYKKRLLDQIKSDQIEKQQAQSELSGDLVKTEKAVLFGECTIKIRYEGGFKILNFKKKDTTAILFEKVENEFKIKGFHLFLIHPHTEIIPSERTLEETGLVPTCMLMVIL